MKNGMIVILILIATASIIVSGCTGNTSLSAGTYQSCGDSICSERERASGSCPYDCSVNTNINNASKVRQANPRGQPVESCMSEGKTIPMVPDAPKCCEGLTMIPPKQSSMIGISGICTAKCGNGVCDPDSESPANCPADCQEVRDARPVCDGVGTTKEGWYQNDKILFYSYCKGCVTECKFKGTASEGWYNACTGKQIKRMCT
jgi:hypothetical protein